MLMQMFLLIISGVTAKRANGQTTDHDDYGQLKLCKFWVAFG